MTTFPSLTVEGLVTAEGLHVTRHPLIVQNLASLRGGVEALGVSSFDAVRVTSISGRDASVGVFTDTVEHIVVGHVGVATISVLGEVLNLGTTQGTTVGPAEDETARVVVMNLDPTFAVEAIAPNVAVHGVETTNIYGRTLDLLAGDGGLTLYGDWVSITGGTLGFFGAFPVAQQTGWGDPTGTASRATFATGSVTTAQLAGRVMALILDLKALGLIGG